ncbi:dihydropteroate synthase [Thermodesulfobacterium sp. TA1]|uniref:dihydropteroate synthase n=1 Tax=Thermodesulfobacterium sp. TA1 TaxID=2234087 RepID=UPI001231EC49|nr:dihydropteroate synthase [Thermodesulfobacterium sp. TA1]QER42154.1 dihydropteroate synthase [Thermodesulfobacterium sp. TA1]
MLSPLRIGSKIFDWKDCPYFFGVLNITPDSFSDGGRFFNLKDAVLRAKELIEEGADIIDIGGESTRPFSDPITEEEELKRVIPVVKVVCEEFPGAIVSVDTYKSKVAEEALKAGASMINDISAGTFDPNMVDVVKDFGCPYVIMHIKGTPKNMQENPIYQDVVKEVREFLVRRIEFLVDKGVSVEKIIIDPGLGFGKTFEHNLEILKNLEEFYTLERPLLLGHSRKSFVGKIVNRENPLAREGGTVGFSVWAYLKRVHFLRVHRVDLNKDAVIMFKFLREHLGG